MIFILPVSMERYGEIWVDLGLSEVILVGKGVTKKVYSLKGSGHRELDIWNAGRNEFVKNFVTYMYNVLCK